MLDGQGADEMMAGYLPYYFVYLRQLLSEKRWGTLIVEVLSSLDVVTKYILLKLRNIGATSSTGKVLKKSFSKKFSSERFLPNQKNLKLRLVEDIFYNSLPSLLRYEDKNSMRFSIEGRVPFLDVDLLKLLFSLPDSAIIQYGWNKKILRDVTKKLLLDTIS